MTQNVQIWSHRQSWTWTNMYIHTYTCVSLHSFWNCESLIFSTPCPEEDWRFYLTLNKQKLSCFEILILFYFALNGRVWKKNLWNHPLSSLIQLTSSHTFSYLYLYPKEKNERMSKKYSCNFFKVTKYVCFYSKGHKVIKISQDGWGWFLLLLWRNRIP